MVGAVLYQELLLGSRRNRLHVLRWIYAGWLVVVVLGIYLGFQSEQFGQQMAARSGLGGSDLVIPSSAPQVVGGRFVHFFVVQQLILLVLATPTFVAGAITDEKRRGTLQYLLVADLGTRHIIIGKLLGRMVQVALLALAGLPLFAFLGGFGGIAPLTMLLAGVVLVMPLFGLASASLLASVCCRQTRDAVLALYGIGALGFLIVWTVPGMLDPFNPLWVLAPAWGPPEALDLSEVSWRLALSVMCWGMLGGICLGLAVACLRRVYIRELESSRPTPPRWYSGTRAPVHDEPVHWRERHVEGLAPNPSLRRIPQWLGVLLVSSVTLVSSSSILVLSLAPGTTGEDVLRALLHRNMHRLARLLPDAADGFLVQSVAAMLLASLVVGIRCSGAVTGERERQTWEAVLLTPLSAKQIIRGKLWGVMGASYWYLLAYAAPAVTLSVLGGVLALAWTLVWLAVTVLAMYFVGAAGLWCSVSSRSWWRSLLGTLGLGYVGGLCIYLVTTPFIWILSLLLVLLLYFVDVAVGSNMAEAAMRNFTIYLRLFFLASCLGLALIFWLMARLFLNRAQRWVADRERTRHWYDEPVYRRRRRAEAPPRLTH